MAAVYAVLGHFLMTLQTEIVSTETSGLQGYKTFFMLNSVEHEIFIAH